MCMICHQTPCHPRCPNAPEPKWIYQCSKCGEGIFAGDKYIDTGTETICEWCAEDMTVQEVLELFGEGYQTAS